jgi:predicted transcriptional regulator
VQDALFEDPGTSRRPPEPVLMSLNPQYYDLMWQGLKWYEFRRRYLTDCPTTWYVYLTVPASRLAAVIDLEPAVVGSPQTIAALAEQAREGNGAPVHAYLRDLEHGFALPIRRVREFEGFTATELRELLGSFHPPQGYTLINNHPQWRAVCDKLTSQPLVRETVIAHPTTAE